MTKISHTSGLSTNVHQIIKNNICKAYLSISNQDMLSIWQIWRQDKLICTGFMLKNKKRLKSKKFGET